MPVHPPPPSPLAELLPPAQAAVVGRLAHVFSENGRDLVLVGGIVRDMLLGLELPSDLDFATNAQPEESTALGQQAGADSVYLSGLRFGTVGLVFGQPASSPALTVEITTYRAEHYPDESRHPEVEFGHRLEDDLARRDFTINAIAENLYTGELIDPFDGRADLARGIIRAVGDPAQRFEDDPLRLLRAARFVSQLGFMVDAGTLRAMQDAAESIRRISQERIYNELTRMLTGPYVAPALDVLKQTGLLELTMPELGPLSREASETKPVHREKNLWEHTKTVVGKVPIRPVIRWAALLHDATKPLTRGIDATGEVHFFGHEREGALMAKRLLMRLKADRHTQAAVSLLVELHGRPGTYERDWTDSAVRRLMLDGGEVLDDLLDLAAADVTSARPFRQKAAAQRIADLREHIDRLEAERMFAQWQSPLDGEELMREFGRSPGRWIGEVKDQLRELVIDGDLAPDDKQGALRIARELVQNAQAHDSTTASGRPVKMVHQAAGKTE